MGQYDIALWHVVQHHGEQAALSAKASTLDGEQAAEALRSLDGDALRTWLLGPDPA